MRSMAAAAAPVEEESIQSSMMESESSCVPTTSSKQAIVSADTADPILLSSSESHETKDARDEDSVVTAATRNNASDEQREEAQEEKKPSPTAVPRTTTTTTTTSTSTSTNANNNNTKKRTKNNNNANKNLNNNNGIGNNNNNNNNGVYPYPRQPWVAPYGPPPYGYPGGNGPYGPPPPHYSHPHHHPHAPHPHMMPHPHYGGAYGGPPPPHAGGNRGANGNNGGGGQGYPGHLAYGVGPPPYGMYGMPPSYPPNNCGGMPSLNSDSASVSSGRSKNSKTSQRKRTIDGIQAGNNNIHGHADLPPSAYQFRRSDSNSSSTSTVTASNNTSMDTHHTSSDSAADAGIERSGSNDFLFNNPNSNNNDDARKSNNRGYHRRDYSAASTASSLSVGGFSLNSYEGPRGTCQDLVLKRLLVGWLVGRFETKSHACSRVLLDCYFFASVGGMDDAMMVDVTKSSPKRHKSNSRGSLAVDTHAHIMMPPAPAHLDSEHSSRFGQLTMDDKRPTSTSSHSSAGDCNLFLSLSTSPINHATDHEDVDATPLSKNTAKAQARKDKMTDTAKSAGIFKSRPGAGPSLKLETTLSEQDHPSDTPGLHTEDQSLLNSHLRGQSFTPLPHMSQSEDSTTGISPSNGVFSAGIAPQLSWSIAGDTPSLGDLADWEEDNKSKGEKTRPSSTTSAETQGMLISPQDFQLWKEEHDLADGGLSGTTTPLPFFMEQAASEGRESNNIRMDQSRMTQTARKMTQPHAAHHQLHHNHHPGDPNQMHQTFLNSAAREQGIKSFNKASMHPMWNKNDMPPTPLFAASDYRDDFFGARSPMDGDRRDSMDFFAANHMFGHGPHSHHIDRVRNLRGRVPPGSHLPPMPLHIPPLMSSHLPMTSPMGLGPGKSMGMWSPHHGMPPPMGSPHHMASPLSSMAQSKRKCVPLKPPIPSKFQGNIEKTSKSPVPEFTSLVNFPAHMSQKQSGNLPEGIRCCVMCGSACPCSSSNKCKKSGSKNGAEGGLAPRNSNGQDLIGDKNGGYAIIPTQNKGLCTLCDVNVWVVVTTGLEIKWCKGCKNFRPWAAFGDKGLATKCLRCRERQREKYALQKEEKEKTRMLTKVKA